MRTADAEAQRSSPFSWFPLIVLSAAIVTTAVVSVSNIRHGGYILDEEITHVLVPSLTKHPLPTLPSGLLYLRGLPYLYGAAAAARLFGYGLTTYRALSLFSALLALATLYRAGRTIASPGVGAIAAVLLCCFPGFLAIATFARPYSLLLAVLPLGLIYFQESHDGRRSDARFLICVVICRLLHEFGLSLILLPILAAVSTTDRGERRRFVNLSAKTLAIICVVEATLYLAVEHSLTTLFVPMSEAPAFRPLRMPPPLPLHLFALATPSTFLTVVALPLAVLAVVSGIRTGAWWVVAACAVLGAITELGAMVAFVLLAMLARPRRAGTYACIGGLFFGTSALVWVAHTFLRSYVQPSVGAATSLTMGMTPYPLAAVHYIWMRWPAVAWAAAFGACSLVLRERRGHALSVQRVVAALALLIYLSFGVLGIDIQIRFLLLGFPMLLLLAAIGLENGSQAAARLLRQAGLVNLQWTSGIALAALIVVVAIGLRTLDEDDPLRTIGPLTALNADDIVICSEEIACLYLVGRVDYVMLVNPQDLSYYAGRRGSDLRGLYAGTPLASSAADIESILDKQRDRRVVIVLLESGKADIFPMRTIAADLLQRHAGHIDTTTDATIAYFEPTTLGPFTPAGSVETPDVPARTPSTRSR